ncbi:RNA-directed DNA polymerase from mobile element jockey-like isoform X2 [Sinocyclocheilus rhinocerous]|uniref:RNA-directed DNA polymerase from mobile element jockey-like isoform X2 n=1 Tax=Sinocyclocheilus rhinocerous TaxID=307959 RepID=UPI0007B99FDB|nr:PREDICTED: RNA-directed DNA polymerase from mobile element jockey-like isoform X2 [Sinocyclocheilus rhinocerous]
MDSILCLEAEIRKAQINKEVLVGVFFDVEKAYDMLWKEGLLMKLESLRIDGKMYNWILSFLFGRTIQVRVGTAFSQILPIENGTPQGSVSSPILFNLMINDIFHNVDTGIGRSLYADDGALWKRGRNVLFVENKMQKAVNEVENWANCWGFRFSVAKTQVICFSKKKKNPSLNVKMYGYQLEQVNVLRFLGMWMDSKLNFKIHIQKLIEKCKKGINVLRCLSGAEWGASCQSLKRIYGAVIRSNIDYGSVVYSSANKILLKKIEVIQNQALCICCGAFRSSPVASLQVEMGELPLEQRRFQLRLRYWYGVKGHLENHPVKLILKDCWEYEYKEITSFGWVVRKEANSLELKDHEIAPSVAIPAIPPWLFPMPLIDLQIHKVIKKPEMNMPTEVVVQQYIKQEYYSVLQVFTDGSKEPESGRTAAAVYIPTFKIKMAKRLSDHVSVFTTELLAIILALQWIEEVQPERTVICTDSMAALTSLLSDQ